MSVTRWCFCVFVCLRLLLFGGRPPWILFCFVVLAGCALFVVFCSSCGGDVRFSENVEESSNRSRNAGGRGILRRPESVLVCVVFVATQGGFGVVRCLALSFLPVVIEMGAVVAGCVRFGVPPPFRSAGSTAKTKNEKGRAASPSAWASRRSETCRVGVVACASVFAWLSGSGKGWCASDAKAGAKKSGVIAIGEKPVGLLLFAFVGLSCLLCAPVNRKARLRGKKPAVLSS